MNATEILDQIRALYSRAESGEDFAEICRLEALYVALTGKQMYL